MPAIISLSGPSRTLLARETDGFCRATDALLRESDKALGEMPGQAIPAPVARLAQFVPGTRQMFCSLASDQALTPRHARSPCPPVSNEFWRRECFGRTAPATV